MKKLNYKSDYYFTEVDLIVKHKERQTFYQWGIFV